MVLIIPNLLIIVVAVLVILDFCLRTKQTLEGLSGDLDQFPPGDRAGRGSGEGGGR